MGKRIENVKRLIDINKNYSLDEGISFFLKDYAKKYKAKFDETIEFILGLGVDIKQSDQMVRGVVRMPHRLGKKKRVAVITSSEKIQEAKNAGAEEVGGEDLIEKIKSGFFDFDICIATSDMMAKVAVIGKLLGPKGMMPNPKLGTVSDDIFNAVKSVKKGRVEFKIDKSGIIHAGIGKLEFNGVKIKENMMEFYKAILAVKPAKLKGPYVKNSFLSTTHGPSLRLDFKTFIV